MVPSHAWRWLLSLVLLVAACRETDPRPEPKNRAEATRLEKQGHSFAVRNRPAWADESKPVRVPPGWVQAGRGSWVLGQMTMQRNQGLGELGDLAALEGKRARVRGPVRACPGERTLVVLEDSGRALVCRLKGELPESAAGRRAVIEGELRRPSDEVEAKAAGRCLGQERAPLVLHASGALVHLPGGIQSTSGR